MTDSGSFTVRFASWNAMQGAWGSPEQFAEQLKPFRPDIVGLNEVPAGDFTPRLAKALGLDYHVI